MAQNFDTQAFIRQEHETHEFMPELTLADAIANSAHGYYTEDLHPGSSLTDSFLGGLLLPSHEVGPRRTPGDAFGVSLKIATQLLVFPESVDRGATFPRFRHLLELMKRTSPFAIFHSTQILMLNSTKIPIHFPRLLSRKSWSSVTPVESRSTGAVFKACLYISGLRGRNQSVPIVHGRGWRRRGHCLPPL